MCDRVVAVLLPDLHRGIRADGVVRKIDHQLADADHAFELFADILRLFQRDTL